MAQLFNQQRHTTRVLVNLGGNKRVGAGRPARHSDAGLSRRQWAQVQAQCVADGVGAVVQGARCEHDVNWPGFVNQFVQQLSAGVVGPLPIVEQQQWLEPGGLAHRPDKGRRKIKPRCRRLVRFGRVHSPLQLDIDLRKGQQHLSVQVVLAAATQATPSLLAQTGVKLVEHARLAYASLAAHLDNLASPCLERRLQRVASLVEDIGASEQGRDPRAERGVKAAPVVQSARQLRHPNRHGPPWQHQQPAGLQGKELQARAQRFGIDNDAAGWRQGGQARCGVRRVAHQI